MDEAIVQQILDELLSSLEPLETQSAALLQFLKAKGIASDDELAPFLEQAANTSNIRWRAVRVRMAGLISSAMKPAEAPVESSTKKTQPVAKSSLETSGEKTEKETDQKNEITKDVKDVKEKESEPDSRRTNKAGDASSKAADAAVSRDEENEGGNGPALPHQTPARDNAKDPAKNDSD